MPYRYLERLTLQNLDQIQTMFFGIDFPSDQDSRGAIYLEATQISLLSGIVDLSVDSESAGILPSRVPSMSRNHKPHDDFRIRTLAKRALAELTEEEPIGCDGRDAGHYGLC